MVLVWAMPDLQGHCLLLRHLCLRATGHKNGSCIAVSSSGDTCDTEALAVVLNYLSAKSTSVSSKKSRSYFKRHKCENIILHDK